MTTSLTGENFQNNLLKAKISGLYCSPVQLQIVHLDAGRVSRSLQICPEGGHNNQNYALSLKASLYDQNRYSYPIGLFWANLAQIWPKNWPNFGPLDKIFTGVSSNNLMYALVVVSILKNIQWAKVSGLFFKNWLFGPDLAQIWPKFGPNLAQFGPIDPFSHWSRLK